MHNLADLYSKRSNYRTLRENVINSINILSRVEIGDNLSTVSYTLENNYTINDGMCMVSKVNSVNTNINEIIKNLNVCLNSINSKLYSLNLEIEKLETENIA